MRLAFGVVKAYLEDDRSRVAPFTHIDGLFAKETGDEPWMMHRALKGQEVPILISPDRYRAGERAQGDLDLDDKKKT